MSTSGGRDDPATPAPVTFGRAPLPPPPASPLDQPPERRPGSVRRTSSIDMTWPDGAGRPMRMVGRARDIRTSAGGAAEVLAYDTMEAFVARDRSVTAVSCEPARPGVSQLVGARGGSSFRSAVNDAIPEERAAQSPLALLFDDVAGASLLGNFAWSRHGTDWLERMRATDDGTTRPRRPPVGICTGFRPGSSTLEDRRGGVPHVRVARVPPLADPRDPQGWHPLPMMATVAFRRARRMDVWRDGGLFGIDAHFRDSCADPVEGEVAVHEYSLTGTVDARSLRLVSLEATPRVLPHPECPDAAPKAPRLVGERVSELRQVVLRTLTGVDCCTHLNDALRALADVATLVRALAALERTA